MNKYEMVAFIIFFPTVAATLVALVSLYLKHRQPPAIASHADERLARIENAVEAIAVEVERISEAQRFSAKLLADGRPAPDALPVARQPEGRGRG